MSTRPLFGGELFGSAAVPCLGGGCMAEGVELVSVWARRERQRVRVWAVRVSAQVVGGGAVPSYVPVRALIKRPVSSSQLSSSANCCQQRGDAAKLLHTSTYIHATCMITPENATEKSPEARDVAGNTLVSIPIL